MANAGKPKLVKSNDKPRLGKGVSKETEAVVLESSPSEKKVSQKLLETIERRKKNKAASNGQKGMFARPMGRRGRRPKGAVEYTPEHQEEDPYVMESDHDSIEYDTGIRLKHGKDDSGINLDFDFDEELNFDR